MDCCSATKRMGWRNCDASCEAWSNGSSSNNTKRPERSVPSWEKRFCATIGMIPWRKVVEIKKYMHLYPNVVEWDDGAGEEAFKSAKNRYWAEVNGSHCDAKLPDPDIYIDEVDWDASIDPELVSDLDRERERSLAWTAECEAAEKEVSLLVDIDPRLLANYGWEDDVQCEEQPPLMKPLGWINCNQTRMVGIR